MQTCGVGNVDVGYDHTCQTDGYSIQAKPPEQIPSLAGDGKGKAAVRGKNHQHIDGHEAVQHQRVNGLGDGEQVHAVHGQGENYGQSGQQQEPSRLTMRCPPKDKQHHGSDDADAVHPPGEDCGHQPGLSLGEKGKERAVSLSNSGGNGG